MRVAVLGGGLTGLTAAWRLAAAGHKVRVLDAGPRPGGVIRTTAEGGWRVDGGPISLQESTPELGLMLRELGLAAERIESSPAAANRYIARGDGLKAVPAPSSMTAFLATPLLSLRSKMAVASEASRKPVARAADVSVADLTRDHFGADILETLVQPLIGGIYAGDAERLSVQYAFPKIWEAERKTGSLVKAAAEASRERKAQGLPSPAPLISFKQGLQALPDALAARLPEGAFVANADVRSVSRGTGARWNVHWVGTAGPKAMECDAVVLALPAWSLARLEIGAAGLRPLAGLERVEYAPVASLFLGYRRDRVRHPLDGFGALVPAAERRTLLGAVFVSTLFPGRAPDGHVALNVFAGGALRPDVVQLPEAELVARVGADLKALVGADGPPAFVRRTPWPRAIPQYNLGYGAHLEAMRRCEADHPGLFIGGNVRDGISLPDCIASGTSLAQRVS
jgi:oxygen-dependent protoporphyrinogen oxidase